MPEQKLTWEQMPEAIKLITCIYGKMQKTFQLQMANEIMEAVKAELWRCYCDTKCGPDIDFETWYKNTYLK